MRIGPTHFLFAIAAIVMVDTLVADPAAARHGFVGSHHHWLGVCSVLSRHPCTPTVCSVFHRGPCIPEIEYPIGEDLRLTIIIAASDAKSNSVVATPGSGVHDAKSDAGHRLNTIREVFDALRACWIPPPESEARPNLQMSVRFSFRCDGEIISAPRVTYKSPDAPPETISLYHNAITSALDRCAPLPLTRGLGNAMAGRPIAIRFVDNRKHE